MSKSSYGHIRKRENETFCVYWQVVQHVMDQTESPSKQKNVLYFAEECLIAQFRIIYYLITHAIDL